MNWIICFAAVFALITNTQLCSNAKKSKYENNKVSNSCDRIGICGPCMPEGLNPAARPLTEDPCCCEQGEFSITIAGFYWQATEDGLDYAVLDKTVATGMDPDGPVNTTNLATLVDAHFLTPDFKWRPGFKVGIGYNGTHDGWDLELIWTHFNGRGKDDEEADAEDLISAISLWSDFSPSPTLPSGLDPTGGTIIHAASIETSWRLDLNLVDLELGKEFWTSKYFSLRPFVGFRFASIKQRYEIDNAGGTWALPAITATNKIEMKNNFAGGGARGGLNAVWNFGCCDPCSGNWGIFGTGALSIVYGRFEVDQEESNRSVTPPTFTKTSILETSDHFKAAKAMLDLIVGIQWATLYSNDNYAFLMSLAWEQHYFFNQNQLWRVNNIGDTATGLHGENVFAQTRGDLSTQGVTLTLNFTF